MIKLAAYAALAMAGALLSLQVVAALEYTQGGSLYTRASMIAAMITVAALPVFIEAARHARARATMVALFVAFVAMLAYSLPAQVGRAGEVKATKVQASEVAGSVRADLAQTKTRLAWATDDWQKECASGAGKACRGKGQTVQALQARAEKLATDLANAPVGDVSSSTLSWATAGYVSAEVWQRSGPLAFALGMDVAIWSLIWLATAIFVGARETQPTVTATVSTVSPTVSAMPSWTETDDLTDDQLDELRKLIIGAGRTLNNNEVAALCGVKKGTASKWVSKGCQRGLMSRTRKGREVAISAARLSHVTH